MQNKHLFNPKTIDWGTHRYHNPKTGQVETHTDIYQPAKSGLSARFRFQTRLSKKIRGKRGEKRER